MGTEGRHHIPNGKTLLMVACEQGRSLDVKILLQKKPLAIASRDRGGKTALHYCAEAGSVACAQQILCADASLIHAQDKDGYTPLHLAVIAGSRHMVKFLLKRGADANGVDKERHSCVHWATVCGDLDTLEVLLNHGASPSTADLLGAYPIHYAAQMCGPHSLMGNDTRLGIATLRKLIRGGAPIHCRDRDGREPILWAASAALHCAASRGHTGCVETLVTLCGAGVNVGDIVGCTPLFYAAAQGHADSSQTLLKYGADPNFQDHKGRTPGHCAATKGQLETIRILDSNGADLWIRNSRGNLPLHEAVQCGRKDLVQWLLQQNPPAVNATNISGRTPLHIAAQGNNVEMCEVLIDYGAYINPLMVNPKGFLMTPLDAAVHQGNQRCAKYVQLHGGVLAKKVLENNGINRSLLYSLGNYACRRKDPDEDVVSVSSVENRAPRPSTIKLEPKEEVSLPPQVASSHPSRADSVLTNVNSESPDASVHIHLSREDLWSLWESFMNSDVQSEERAESECSCASGAQLKEHEGHRSKPTLVTNVYLTSAHRHSQSAGPEVEKDYTKERLRPLPKGAARTEPESSDGSDVTRTLKISTSQREVYVSKRKESLETLPSRSLPSTVELQRARNSDSVQLDGEERSTYSSDISGISVVKKNQIVTDSELSVGSDTEDVLLIKKQKMAKLRKKRSDGRPLGRDIEDSETSSGVRQSEHRERYTHVRKTHQRSDVSPENRAQMSKERHGIGHGNHDHKKGMGRHGERLNERTGMEEEGVRIQEENVSLLKENRTLYNETERRDGASHDLEPQISRGALRTVKKERTHIEDKTYFSNQTIALRRGMPYEDLVNQTGDQHLHYHHHHHHHHYHHVHEQVDENSERDVSISGVQEAEERSQLLKGRRHQSRKRFKLNWKPSWNRSSIRNRRHKSDNEFHSRERLDQARYMDGVMRSKSEVCLDRNPRSLTFRENISTRVTVGGENRNVSISEIPDENEESMKISDSVQDLQGELNVTNHSSKANYSEISQDVPKRSLQDKPEETQYRRSRAVDESEGAQKVAQNLSQSQSTESAFSTDLQFLNSMKKDTREVLKTSKEEQFVDSTDEVFYPSWEDCAPQDRAGASGEANVEIRDYKENVHAGQGHQGIVTENAVSNRQQARAFNNEQDNRILDNEMNQNDADRERFPQLISEDEAIGLDDSAHNTDDSDSLQSVIENVPSEVTASKNVEDEVFDDGETRAAKQPENFKSEGTSKCLTASGTEDHVVVASQTGLDDKFPEGNTSIESASKVSPEKVRLSESKDKTDLPPENHETNLTGESGREQHAENFPPVSDSLAEDSETLSSETSVEGERKKIVMSGRKSRLGRPYSKQSSAALRNSAKSEPIPESGTEDLSSIKTKKPATAVTMLRSYENGIPKTERNVTSPCTKSPKPIDRIKTVANASKESPIPVEKEVEGNSSPKKEDSETSDIPGLSPKTSQCRRDSFAVMDDKISEDMDNIVTIANVSGEQLKSGSIEVPAGKDALEWHGLEKQKANDVIGDTKSRDFDAPEEEQDPACEDENKDINIIPESAASEEDGHPENDESKINQSDYVNSESPEKKSSKRKDSAKPRIALELEKLQDSPAKDVEVIKLVQNSESVRNQGDEVKIIITPDDSADAVVTLPDDDSPDAVVTPPEDVPYVVEEDTVFNSGEHSDLALPQQDVGCEAEELETMVAKGSGEKRRRKSPQTQVRSTESPLSDIQTVEDRNERNRSNYLNVENAHYFDDHNESDRSRETDPRMPDDSANFEASLSEQRDERSPKTSKADAHAKAAKNSKQKIFPAVIHRRRASVPRETFRRSSEDIQAEVSGKRKSDPSPTEKRKLTGEHRAAEKARHINKKSQVLSKNINSPDRKGQSVSLKTKNSRSRSADPTPSLDQADSEKCDFPADEKAPCEKSEGNVVKEQSPKQHGDQYCRDKYKSFSKGSQGKEISEDQKLLGHYVDQETLSRVDQKEQKCYDHSQVSRTNPSKHVEEMNATHENGHQSVAKSSDIKRIAGHHDQKKDLKTKIPVQKKSPTINREATSKKLREASPSKAKDFGIKNYELRKSICQKPPQRAREADELTVFCNSAFSADQDRTLIAPTNFDSTAQKCTRYSYSNLEKPGFLWVHFGSGSSPTKTANGKTKPVKDFKRFRVEKKTTKTQITPKESIIRFTPGKSAVQKKKALEVKKEKFPRNVHKRSNEPEQKATTLRKQKYDREMIKETTFIKSETKENDRSPAKRAFPSRQEIMKEETKGNKKKDRRPPSRKKYPSRIPASRKPALRKDEGSLSSNRNAQDKSGDISKKRNEDERENDNDQKPPTTSGSSSVGEGDLRLTVERKANPEISIKIKVSDTSPKKSDKAKVKQSEEKKKTVGDQTDLSTSLSESGYSSVKDSSGYMSTIESIYNNRRNIKIDLGHTKAEIDTAVSIPPQEISHSPLQVRGTKKVMQDAKLGAKKESKLSEVDQNLTTHSSVHSVIIDVDTNFPPQKIFHHDILHQIPQRGLETKAVAPCPLGDVVSQASTDSDPTSVEHPQAPDPTSVEHPQAPYPTSVEHPQAPDPTSVEHLHAPDPTSPHAPDPTSVKHPHAPDPTTVEHPQDPDSDPKSVEHPQAPDSDPTSVEHPQSTDSESTNAGHPQAPDKVQAIDAIQWPKEEDPNDLPTALDKLMEPMESITRSTSSTESMENSEQAVASPGENESIKGDRSGKGDLISEESTSIGTLSIPAEDNGQMLPPTSKRRSLLKFPSRIPPPRTYSESSLQSLLMRRDYKPKIQSRSMPSLHERQIIKGNKTYHPHERYRYPKAKETTISQVEDTVSRFPAIYPSRAEKPRSKEHVRLPAVSFRNESSHRKTTMPQIAVDTPQGTRRFQGDVRGTDKSSTEGQYLKLPMLQQTVRCKCTILPQEQHDSRRTKSAVECIANVHFLTDEELARFEGRSRTGHKRILRRAEVKPSYHPLRYRALRTQTLKFLRSGQSTRDRQPMITFHVDHDKERNTFKLPTSKLNENKKWQVVFTIGKTEETTGEKDGASKK